MQCLCAGQKGKENGNAEEECEHSFCTIQRQKKQTKCVDIPPKGLPWSSGYLKYLPGQRNFYKDLYLKDQADQEAIKMTASPPPKKCKGKNGKRKSQEADAACLCFCAPTNGGGKKKRRSKSISQKPSETCSEESSSNTRPNMCIEFEEVYVCDGNSPQPRKGYLIKPCKRPEAEQALEVASEAMRSDEQDEGGNNGQMDKGVICLCIPRSYLEQYRGPEEDLCAKYGIKMECPEGSTPPAKPEENSEAVVESRKSQKSNQEEEEEEE